MAKMYKERFNTCVGTLNWVFINGDGRDTSEKRDGSKMQKMATLTLKADSPEAAKLKAKLEEIWQNAVKAEPKIGKRPASSLGYRLPRDKETGEETGMIDFIFKTNAKFPDGREVVIPTYNAKGDRVDLGDKIIGNGSAGVIYGEAGLYEYMGKYGITLYLKAVQVVRLETMDNGVECEDLSNLYPDSFEVVAPEEESPEL